MRALYAAAERRFRGEEADEPGGLSAETALMARARKDGSAAALRHKPEWDTAELVLIARDRHGLFADVAQVLTIGGADVTGARLTTTDDGWAFDLFQLQDGQGRPFGLEDPRQSRRLESAVVRASLSRGGRAKPAGSLLGRASVFDVAPVVAFDNPQGGLATIVETSGRDRPGLLADLARALADAGLTIRSAHIESHGARAVDAFYVTDKRGGRVTTPTQQARVRAALMTALQSSTDPSPPSRLARARASVAR